MKRFKRLFLSLVNILKAQIHSVTGAAKIYADFCPLLTAVHFYDVSFYALKRPFDYHNAVVFVKFYKRRADFRSKSQKMLDNK